MTQAPTPGPLTADWTIHDGGECPFEPGTVLDVLYGDGEEQKSVALYEGHGSWAYGPDGVHETDVVAYRVVSAPTAPVEASGSEREEFVLVPRKAVRSMTMAGCDRLPAVDGVFGVAGALCSNVWDAMVEEGEKLASASRPQPSGETREAVARIVDPDAYDNLGGTLSSVRAVSAESKADRILALLSARPLALGGQQGGVPLKWVEVARYATERGLTLHESNMRMEEFRRVVTPAAVLSVSADEEIK